jgi:hypothetical protein
MDKNYITDPLSSRHNKEIFDCGKELLNRYIHKQVSLGVKKKNISMLHTC